MVPAVGSNDSNHWKAADRNDYCQDQINRTRERSSFGRQPASINVKLRFRLKHMNSHTVRLILYQGQSLRGHMKRSQRVTTLLDHVFQVDFQINIQRSKGIWVWIRSDHIGEGKTRVSVTCLIFRNISFELSVWSILLALVSFMMDYSRIIRFDFLKDNPLIRNMIDLLSKVQLVFRYPMWLMDFGQFWNRTFSWSITAVNGKGLQISGNRGFDINKLGSSPSPLEVNYRKSDIPRVKFGFYLRARIKLNWFINK